MGIFRGKTDARTPAPAHTYVLGALPWSSFAAEDGPHTSLVAEEVFSIGGFSVTNSMIYGALITALIALTGYLASRKASVSPRRGLVLPFELLLGFIRNILMNVFDSKHKARKYTPVFSTFFIFIIFTNLSGILPLVGEGITSGETPVFRPFTADINGTLALSLFGIVTVQYLSIKENGVKGHLQHYFSDKPYNPINLFVGVLEVLSELTRVASLALRLFLNTAVGEILIATFLFLGAAAGSFTVMPIALFEILVAFVQALIFTVLTSVYLSIAISHSEDSHAHTETGESPERIRNHSLDEAPALTGSVPAGSKSGA